MNMRILAAIPFALVASAAAGLSAADLEVNIGFDGSGGMIIHKKIDSIQERQQRNVVMQKRDYSCGAAALATLFNFYLREPVEETEIIRSLLDLNKKKGTLEKVIERKGFSLLDLKHFAEEKNFKSEGYRLKVEDLVKLKTPAIVPIIPHGYKHFVVFRGADQERAYIADPSAGNITMPLEQFEKDWYGFTNVALVVMPQDGRLIEEHLLSLGEMDQLFIEQNNFPDLMDRTGLILPHIPGEF
ncbi:MAG TPA: C39 family peptidase [Nitrospiria bacterium]